VDIDVILESKQPAAALSELGQLAEQHGIRAVWVSSLLDSRDPYANFALLAQRSAHIHMGPIAVNPFDTHPVRIAAGILTLNELCNGRAQIVIGGGGEALEALAIQPARRVRAVRECVEIMRGVAAGKRFTYEGGLYKVRGYHLDWAEAPPPRIYVGANGPQMLRMAARCGDGIMLSDMPAALVPQAMKSIDAGLAAVQRGRSALALSNFMAWHVYPDRDQAYREGRQWLLLRGLFRPHILKLFLEPADVDLVMASKAAFIDAFQRRSPDVAGVPAAVLDALVSHLTLAGSLDDLDAKIDKLRSLAAAGLTEVALRLYHDPAAGIKLLGERVIPALKA
jgi:alkanesulfonate monooxygenase SsuD/methylene tetrahydromethanopterin reductase-like flavin-dependent oxidoreductase (luciferase family)